MTVATPTSPFLSLVSAPLRQAALAAAKAGSAETALPLLLDVCAVNPEDVECRLHLAASLARLGFGIPSLAVLANVPASPLREQVARVAATCRTPAVPLTQRQNRARACAALLQPCFPAQLITNSLASANELVTTSDLFIGTNSRALLWVPPAPISSSASHPHSARVRTTLLGLQTDAATAVAATADQVVLLGANWPALAAALATPSPLPAGWGPGYQRRVHVLTAESQAHLLTAILVSSAADASLDFAGAARLIPAEQLLLHAAPGATGTLSQWYRQHIHLRLAGPIIPIASPLVSDSALVLGLADVQSVVQVILDQQRALVTSLCQKLGIGQPHATDPNTNPIAHPSPASSGLSLQTSTGQQAAKKRLLIITTRYSTFMQHSAKDLAAAIIASGHDAEVLLEDDDHSVFASPALLSAQLRIKPDAVVMINYTRSAVPDSVPASTPIITWVQDALGHLFDERAGNAVGPRDIVVGHVFHELIARFGFPADRVLQTPVLINPAKFAGPHDPALVAKHRCDIAYVSHQSQTPEQLCAKLQAEVGDAAGGRLRQAIGLLFAGTWMAVSNSSHEMLAVSLPYWVSFVLSKHNLAAEPGLPQRMLATVAWPLAERLLRHRMLQWTVDIANRRGWSVRLYGNGWDKHHAWSSLAAGKLEHGSELAASYAAATVHLHASVGSYMHQRVPECAAAGGVPLIFRKADDVYVLEHHTNLVLVRDAVPASMSEIWPDRARQWTAAADHPASLRFVAQCQRLGVPHNNHFPGYFHLRPELANAALSQPSLIAGSDDAFWLLGDLAETTFSSENELEICFERFITSPTLRDETSHAIRTRACRSLNYEALVPKLIAMLDAPPSAPKPTPDKQPFV